MVPGFHCSSLEFHDPASVIPELAALGFGAVAIRPRRGGWDPKTSWFASASAEIAAAAKEHSIDVVVDLDAPYFDDPHRSEPLSLASVEPSVAQQAQDSIRRWIDRTADLSPRVISFSSGRESPSFVDVVDPGLGQRATQPAGEQTLERLAAAIEPLSTAAISVGGQLALRPVSEHAIATVAHFERFDQWIDADVGLGLAADVGEMLLGGEFPIGARLARLQRRLNCVYLCEPDLERGCDQRFGHGDIDLRRVWDVMTESGFRGPAVFRACGHGRQGLDLAREALALLDPHN